MPHCTIHVYTSVNLLCSTAHWLSPLHLLYSLSHLNSARKEEEKKVGPSCSLRIYRLCSAFGDFINENQLNRQEMGGTVALAVTSASGTKPKLALTTKSYSEGQSSHLHKDMLIDNKMLSGA